MQFKARQEAQGIILRRVGAIVERDGRTVPAENFVQAATMFADLIKKGKNYIQIEREIRDYKN